MPEYSFFNPDNESEIIDVFFHMNDKKTFIGPDGKEWKRLYTVPRASIDTKIDPSSRNQFVRATDKYKSVGDLLSVSSELSEKRAADHGKSDPIKEKFLKEYSKSRKGAKHPSLLGQKIDAPRYSVDFSKK